MFGVVLYQRMEAHAKGPRRPGGAVLTLGGEGEAGPATALLSTLEKLDAELGDVEYLIGLPKNPVLLRQAAFASWPAQLSRRFCAGKDSGLPAWTL